MKIRIITSCTGEKKFSPDNSLKQADFTQFSDPIKFRLKEEQLRDLKTPAEDLYTGRQHILLMEGVKSFRKRFGEDSIELWIVSAGYGIIPGDRKIVPYECTFQTMKTNEIDLWASQLKIPEQVKDLLVEPADLNILLLGNSYLRALQLDTDVCFSAPTIVFASQTSRSRIHGKGQIRIVPLGPNEAKRFHIGLVGLKGALAKQLLTALDYQTNEVPENQFIPSLQKFFDPELEFLDLLPEMIPVSKKPKHAKRTARPNPAVDYIIDIPELWWQKPHRKNMRYFIPDVDDQVDPNYNFENDTHWGDVGDWSNQVYSHQLYPQPNYDGILVSKTVAEKSKKKKERINALGVHRYLRVPKEFPIMGDCGAFGYKNEIEPPFTTSDIIDYYTRLGFDYGVSIDHLIFSEKDTRKEFRYELTIQNAVDFLREHHQQGLPWEPIGAVQGWDPQSYANAARKYVKMGYQYIALGGLARSTTKRILRILSAVREVVPPSVKLHLFGVARIGSIQQFRRLGVNSLDSSSYLRQAWTRNEEGYLLTDGEYAPIRIPEAGKSFRSKRMASDLGLEEYKIIQIEQDALAALRSYGVGNISLDNCLNSILEYDRMIGTNRKDMEELYRQVLQERPWERCDCAECRRTGIEIIVFRGNNRNRRRGFHNTYIFYNLFQKILNGEEVKGWSSQVNITIQPDLMSSIKVQA